MVQFGRRLPVASGPFLFAGPVVQNCRDWGRACSLPNRFLPLWKNHAIVVELAGSNLENHTKLLQSGLWSEDKHAGLLGSGVRNFESHAKLVGSGPIRALSTTHVVVLSLQRFAKGSSL